MTERQISVRQLQTAAVGTHSIVLVVNDGVASGRATINFEVITADRALDEISRSLELSTLPSSVVRPLQAALRPAMNSLDHGNIKHAVDELQVFEFKVQLRLGSSDPVLAERLINATEQVISALVVAN